MSEIELKSCPFCGGKGVMKVNEQTLNCSVHCPKCSVIMKKNFKGSKRIQQILIELMSEEWNRRAE